MKFKLIMLFTKVCIIPYLEPDEFILYPVFLRFIFILSHLYLDLDHLSGLVVGVPGYRFRGQVRFPAHLILWEVVGLERGPLSRVSTIEELLGRKSSSSGLENQEYSHRNLPHWPRDTHNPQKLALTSPTSSGCLVGIVRLQAKATELLLYLDLPSLENFWYSFVCFSHFPHPFTYCANLSSYI
jgi:hypothetical protein